MHFKTVTSFITVIILSTLLTTKQISGHDSDYHLTDDSTCETGGCPAILAARQPKQDLITQLKNALQIYHSSGKNLDPKCSENITLGELLRGHTFLKSGNDSWTEFYRQISSCDLYSSDGIVDKLLQDLATTKIQRVAYLNEGTQVKLRITFTNGQKAVFRPMLYAREEEADENHFYFTFGERHYAEIAAFHLDRLLGFRRALPTVGRTLDVDVEVRQKADGKLKDAFYWSPAGNLCFLGYRDKDTRNAVCAKNGVKEGSLQVFYPDRSVVTRNQEWTAYARTYSTETRKALWQTDGSFCEWNVKRRKIYANGTRLLDLVDVAIFDFLIGNQDRHSDITFTIFNQRTAYPHHLDHGCAFGRTDYDDIDILQPLIQCCVIRPSTLDRLLSLYAGPITLSDALQKAMASDPVAPILAPKHYPALERRLETVLLSVAGCLSKLGDPKVVIRNRYVNLEFPNGLDLAKILDEHKLSQTNKIT